MLTGKIFDVRERVELIITLNFWPKQPERWGGHLFSWSRKSRFICMGGGRIEEIGR